MLHFLGSHQCALFLKDIFCITLGAQVMDFLYFLLALVFDEKSICSISASWKRFASLSYWGRTIVVLHRQNLALFYCCFHPALGRWLFVVQGLIRASTCGLRAILRQAGPNATDLMMNIGKNDVVLLLNVSESDIKILFLNCGSCSWYQSMKKPNRVFQLKIILASSLWTVS